MPSLPQLADSLRLMTWQQPVSFANDGSYERTRASRQIGAAPPRDRNTMASPAKLLVSIHDVTPALDAGVRRLWSTCLTLGVRPALLVVPNWHGRWPLEHFPAFVARLREWSASGAELFLHGERHDEHGLPRGWRDQLRAVGRTAGEGEFLTLDRTAAGHRIDRGLSRLRRLGLQPIGFVPPAWLAREDTFQAVAERGLRVSEDVSSIRIHSPERRVAAPVVRWSARTPIRASTSALVAAARSLRHEPQPVLRVALHPRDLESGVTTRSLERTLRRLVEERRAITYAELAGPRIAPRRHRAVAR